MSACAREANRQSKRSPLACVNFSLSSTLCFDAKLIGLLQTPSYHCALPVDFADSLPRCCAVVKRWLGGWRPILTHFGRRCPRVDSQWLVEAGESLYPLQNG